MRRWLPWALGLIVVTVVAGGALLSIPALQDALIYRIALRAVVPNERLFDDDPMRVLLCGT